MTSAAIAKVNTGGARCQAMLGSTCVTNKMYCHTGVPDMHQYISKIRLGAPSRSSGPPIAGPRAQGQRLCDACMAGCKIESILKAANHKAHHDVCSSHAGMPREGVAHGARRPSIIELNVQ
jgi:hypothetical protein